MNLKRMLASVVAVGSLAVAAVLYGVHPARSSDHQDTYNLANRPNTSADISDVYIFPDPNTPANVVFIMDVSPLIPAGMGTARFFDPSLMWQIKIAHGNTSPEDQVIQFSASGSNASQTITMYGPAKPNEVGTSNTFVAPTGTFNYNTVGSLPNGIQAYAGPRADPFYFDLFQFFSFLGDRNAKNHTSQSDPGTGNTLTGTPTFNGYPAGSTSGSSGNYACSTAPSTNALTDIAGGFNVLAFVVSVPRTLLTQGYSSQQLHVWATVGSASGS